MIPEFIENRFTEDTKKDIKALCFIALIIYLVAVIVFIAFAICDTIGKNGMDFVIQQITSDLGRFVYASTCIFIFFIVIGPLLIYFGLKLIMYAFILIFKLIKGVFAK